MARCQAKTSRGEPCARGAGSHAYCPHHRKRYGAKVTHGLTAQRKTLGIPEKYDSVYQEFYGSDTPTDLRREMAQQRTLFVELRDALHAGDRTDECAARVTAFVMDCLGKDLDPLIREPARMQLIEGLEKILRPFMPLSNMDLDTAEGLSRILIRTAQIAEKMKRIQEGMVLKVEVDQRILVNILQQVIFPVITDSEMRQQIAERASRFSLRRTNAPEVPQGPLSQAENTPQILDHI